MLGRAAGALHCRADYLSSPSTRISGHRFLMPVYIFSLTQPFFVWWSENLDSCGLGIEPADHNLADKEQRRLRAKLPGTSRPETVLRLSWSSGKKVGKQPDSTIVCLPAGQSTGYNAFLQGESSLNCLATRAVGNCLCYS